MVSPRNRARKQPGFAEADAAEVAQRWSELQQAHDVTTKAFKKAVAEDDAAHWKRQHHTAGFALPGTRTVTRLRTAMR